MTFELKQLLDYIPDFCRSFDYPEEATALFSDVLSRAAADEELKNIFFAPAKAYAEKGKFDYRNNLSGNGGVCKTLADKLGVSTYTADFVFCLTFTPYLERKYRENGLSEQMFHDAMIDLKCKLWECKRVYNVWGSFVAGWFCGWFILDRFALGRLQYEPRKHIWICTRVGDKSDKKRVRLFQKFLNIHIPSSGPLREEEVIDSFKQAYEFFSKRGYGKDICYHTSSWLLSPDHKKMFPADSNIVKFINCFKVVKVSDEKNNNDYWRIYNRPYNAQNPDYSGETSMQKGYAEVLGKGEFIKFGAGVFIYDGVKFYH